MKSLRFPSVPMLLLLIVSPAFASAHAQAKPSTAPAAAPVKLQPFTAQDQSVSAGVPSGWKVTSAVGGSFNLAGPQGEGINFGDVFLAQDGPFQLGTKGPGPALMTMPASAKLSDKLIMFLQQENSLAGKVVPQVKFTYAAPLQMPPNMGQCGIFGVDMTTSPATSGMGVFCALPPDTAHLFKLVLILATAPSATSAQSVPTVMAVYNSYKVAPGWVQKMLTPYTRPPSSASAVPGPGSAAEVQMYLNAMNKSQQVIDHGYRCTAAGILGDGSNWETPRECGGWAPNF